MTMQSPVFAHMQRQRQAEFAQRFGGAASPFTGVAIVQDEMFPPGLYTVLGEFCRGGKPWEHIPDPQAEPGMFRDWSKGYVRDPLVWEGDYS